MHRGRQRVYSSCRDRQDGTPQRRRTPHASHATSKCRRMVVDSRERDKRDMASTEDEEARQNASVAAQIRLPSDEGIFFRSVMAPSSPPEARQAEDAKTVAKVPTASGEEPARRR